MTAPDLFTQLIEDAAAHRLQGWDWDWIRDRWDHATTPWDYRTAVSAAASECDALLDIDTGGGEFLSALPSLPGRAVATEAYAPNVPIARERLTPRGVRVLMAHPRALPIADESFDLVINRHGGFDGRELHRVLRPGGRVITQQVGLNNFQELNAFLVGGTDAAPGTFERACEEFVSAGLTIDVAEHAEIPSAFHDIGAVTFYLLGVPWQIPGFDPLLERDRMRALHARISEEGPFGVTAERYFIRARRPD